MSVTAGPRNPTRGTPARTPRSIRRTTSIDMAFPDGFTGEVELRGAGRDLLTSTDDRTAVLAEAGFVARLDTSRRQAVTALSTDPPLPGSETLVETRAGGGYRKALHQLADERRLHGSLLLQLLDDLTGASLVAGYSPQLVRSTFDAETPEQSPHATQIMLAMGDVCAGWRAEGDLFATVAATGSPVLGQGPPAPPWEGPEDPLAWHEMPGPLAPHGMRRVRRIDITAPVGTGPVLVDSAFRDVHLDIEGALTIVHEYSLRAAFDPRTLQVLDIDATPRVLPYADCPGAAASARRLVGTTTTRLRARARTELVGSSTCTHLNDVLRALEDVEPLVARLREEDPVRCGPLQPPIPGGS